MRPRQPAESARIIAVFGGDGRAKQYSWPPNLEVRHYEVDEVSRLLSAMGGGKIAHVVVATKFVNHASEYSVRNESGRAGVEWSRWPRSFNELIKVMPEMFAHLSVKEADVEEPVDPPNGAVYEEPLPVEEPLSVELDPSLVDDPRTPEDIVAEKTIAYGEALVAARKAEVYVADLKTELTRAESTRLSAQTAVKKAHQDLLDAAEKVR